MKTNKTKKVLIALDYDHSAQKVAIAGYELASEMNAEVILLHVIADATYYSALEYSQVTGFSGYMDMSPYTLDSADGLKMASMQYLDKIKHHFHDENILTLVKDGDFADAILQTAKDMHVDVIVMGSHSRRWLENIVMGSVTEEVLHHTSKPLFIVPIKNQA
jgi:nucleotide-binding universal stress UspA family protein